MLQKLLSSLVLCSMILAVLPGTPVVQAQSKQEYSRVLDDPFDKYSFTNVMSMVNTIKNQGNITYDSQNKIVSGLPTGHPRIFITPGNRAALNQKIATHFVTEFQSMVDLVESKWGIQNPYDGRSGKEPEAQPLVLINALIYQIGFVPGVSYAHTQNDYGREAVRLMLGMQNNKYEHFAFLGLPLGYDWTYDLMTDAERQAIADMLMNYVRLDNSQITPRNNAPGGRLLGMLALYGDWQYASEVAVNDYLALFHGGMVFGDTADVSDPGIIWSSSFNLTHYLITTPEGPGDQGLGYSGWSWPVYPFLLAWRNQTGEDYFQLPFFQKWILYFIHATGNEYEHQTFNAVLQDKGHLQGHVNFSFAHAMMELGLTPSNRDMAALAKYHKEETVNVGESLRVLHMLLSDPALTKKSQQDLGLSTTIHIEDVNHIFARNSWLGTDSTWAWFMSSTWNTRDTGALNDILIGKNGGRLLDKHYNRHDYDGGNRTNTLVLYDANLPGTTFTPMNVMDRASSRPFGLRFEDGDSMQDISKNLLGYREGLRYMEEDPGQYIYAFGDGKQRFQALHNTGECCQQGVDIDLPNWTRQFLWFRAPQNSDPDYFVVLDRIDAPQGVSAHMPLHFNMLPEIQDRTTGQDKGAGQQLFPGVYKYGDASRIKVSNTVTTDWGTANGRLFVDTLLPKTVDYYRMGGVAERNVDIFGNVRDKSLIVSGDPNNPQNILWGLWRVQVGDPTASNKTTYLHVMQATDTGVANGVDTTLLEGAGVIGAAVDSKMALFSAAESTINVGSVTIPPGAVGTYDVLIADLEPNTLYDIEFGSVTHDDIASSNQGVLYFQDVTFSNTVGATPDSFWKSIARFLGLGFVLAAESNQVKITKGNAIPDTEPPVISNVRAENVGSTTASVLWSTNESATSRTDYGLSPAYGAAESSAALVKNHAIALSGLSPLTTYHYKVSSLDASGNRAESTNRTFTTTDNDPPSVYAGPDQTVSGPSVTLDGTVDDDGLPNPPGVVTTTWSTVSGPGTATFADASAVDTTATLSAEGTYVLQLEADDGGVTRADTITVTYTSGGGGGSTPCGNIGSVDLTNGLTGLWSFDEGSGTVAADSSGHGNDLTLRNSPAWVPGRLGNAVSFDGLNQDAFVATPSGNILNQYDNLTISMWVNLGNKLDTQRVLLKSDDQYTGVYDVQVPARNNIDQLAFFLVESGSAYDSITDTTPLPRGTWTHITIKYDNADLTYCINGKEDKKVPRTVTPRDTTGGLTIGSNFGVEHFFQGQIDDVCIYNRALNATEIEALATGTACGQPPELCIQGPLENRLMDGESRMDLPNVSVTVTDTVTSTVVKDVVVPMDVSGKISLTDLTGISDTGTYDIAVRPHGLLAKTLSNQTNVISGGCIDAGTFLLIDANGDGLLGLADLVGFVNYYRTLVHGTLEGVFAYLRPGVNHLVRAVANFIAQQ